jgi:hypothetical protein
VNKLLKGLKKYLEIEDSNVKKEMKEERMNQLRIEEYKNSY